jgi:hypothetical protein
MPDVNLAALLERHLAAVRWEEIRVAWFKRMGDTRGAMAARELMNHHSAAAERAAAGLKKNQSYK